MANVGKNGTQVKTAQKIMFQINLITHKVFQKMSLTQIFLEQIYKYPIHFEKN